MSVAEAPVGPLSLVVSVPWLRRVPHGQPLAAAAFESDCHTVHGQGLELHGPGLELRRVHLE